MSTAAKKRLLICSLLFVVSILFGYDTFSRLIGFAWDMIVVFCIAALLLVTILVFIIDLFRKTQYSLYPFTVVLATVLGITIAIKTNYLFSVKRREKANKLVTAINTYHKYHGEYPATLDKLVPQYLAEVPKNRMGFRTRAYLYQSGGNSFTLDWTGKDSLFFYNFSERRIEGWPYTSSSMPDDFNP